ncbi:MAG: hypothetical protein FJW30_13915 [Acidobacteria bacterium]|nr:hypothetical protein [Acidobacteriota bacterium]
MTNAARTGQTLLIVASTMLFAAFTSALVARRAGGDFGDTPLPVWLWASAPLALAASWAVERGFTRSAAAAGAALTASQLFYLGSLHIAQVDQAFRSVFVGAHAAHAAAGACALLLHGRSARLFWHFAGGLWIYVLALLGVWT